MRKIYVLIFSLLASILQMIAAVQGSLPGLFSVSSTKKVYFSQGNLQYQPSTNTWRFAEGQNNYLGAAASNTNRSETYTGWLDEFCYGSSGYNNKYPYGYNYTSGTISGTNYDWGVYNAISNGGNNSGLWRTLTASEWQYLIQSRSNATSRRGQASVDGKNGLVLLPDSWSTPSGVNFTANPGNYTTNVYTMSQWAQMEAAGAVFLPAAGRYDRTGSDAGVHGVGTQGYYWSSSPSPITDSYYIPFGYGLNFSSSSISPQNNYRVNCTLSIRLVLDSDKNTYTITWKQDDGTIIDATEVAKGAVPTHSNPTKASTSQYAYTFKGWTPTIVPATGNATYKATYDSIPRYTIYFDANGGLIPATGNMGNNTPTGNITTLNSSRTNGSVLVTTGKTYFRLMTGDCPSREGYTFSGWYTNQTAGEQVYDNTGAYVVGSYWDSDGKWIGTADLQLYAHWQANVYTITWKNDDGTTIDQTPVEYGQTPTHANPTKTDAAGCDHTFTGWTPTIANVTGDATYTATFILPKYTINAESDDPNQGSATVE